MARPATIILSTPNRLLAFRLRQPLGRGTGSPVGTRPQPPGPPRVCTMSPSPPEPRHIGPPLRVLVVDDNRDCADSTVLLLRAAGFEARACYDGPAALQEVGPFRPGLCFLDLNMPGMDGDDLAVRLRAWA